jgi:hypothetical protein
MSVARLSRALPVFPQTGKVIGNVAASQRCHQRQEMSDAKCSLSNRCCHCRQIKRRCRQAEVIWRGLTQLEMGAKTAWRVAQKRAEANLRFR